MENLTTWLQPSFDFEALGVAEREVARANYQPIPAKPPRALIRAFNRLNSVELAVVRLASRSSRSTAPKWMAITFSWLGNGWLYPLVLATLVARWGVSSLKIAMPACVIAALLHCVYPMLKRYCSRRRPFQADPRLPSLLETLDEHSFPSGHTMTLAGVMTPIVMLWPASLLSALLVVGAVAWSRVATAHHYPSDVVAGAALGVGVGYPMTIGLVALWS